jgi:hypothetical protein
MIWRETTWERENVNAMIILWHIDPLLGNDRERSRYIIAVTEQRFWKQACLHGTNSKQKQRNGVFCVVRAEML